MRRLIRFWMSAAVAGMRRWKRCRRCKRPRRCTAEQRYEPGSPQMIGPHVPPLVRRPHRVSYLKWRIGGQCAAHLACGGETRKVSGTKMVWKTKEFGRDFKKPTFPSSSPPTPATQSGLCGAFIPFMGFASSAGGAGRQLQPRFSRIRGGGRRLDAECRHFRTLQPS